MSPAKAGATPLPRARLLLYLATFAALALIARSLLITPVPLWAAAAGLTGYLGLITTGVLFLRLGMFADVTWRGPSGARGVALTFDDGPSPEHTPKVLDLLEEAGVKATFFVIGRKAERHPDLVREIMRRGHSVGVHGFVHDRMFSLRSPRFIRADLARAVSTLEEITGERPTLFRPPIGHTTARIVAEAHRLELAFVGWSVRGIDGLASSRADKVAQRVVSRLTDGAIVLLHDAAEHDDHVPASLKALPRILEVMRERALAGVRVDDWVPLAEASKAPEIR